MPRNKTVNSVDCLRAQVKELKEALVLSLELRNLRLDSGLKVACRELGREEDFFASHSPEIVMEAVKNRDKSRYTVFGIARKYIVYLQCTYDAHAVLKLCRCDRPSGGRRCRYFQFQHQYLRISEVGK